MSDQSSNSTPAYRTDRVRVLCFITRKEGVSQEEFDRHWLEDNSKLMLSLDIVKKNLLKYEQLHVNQQMKTQLQSFGVGLIQCDGAAICEAESYQKVFNNPEYFAVVRPDEEKFVDTAKTLLLPLDVAVFIDK
ncbi:hypothetical protein D9758_008599 [Tetrapyrgos nigripes]|uniref:EthD domain-containing protein n=1 Tax=Tetrapyrgos nigripes TaxID=182062 RepID=A0A8H5LIY4_9AGAR|nr:hypothetical protein D9758_008599 [Tetrapyrgos nigripes]